MFGELLAPQYLRWLLDGFLLTLGLALLSCLLATLIGAPLAIARLPTVRDASPAARGGTPARWAIAPTAATVSAFASARVPRAATSRP